MSENSRHRRIVICGAGIVGIAAAYNLVVRFGVAGEQVTLIESGHPLSLTSDKSTEAYRNWWPGPDGAMTQFMDRSIDLIEEIAAANANRINLNRRGYAFASADVAKVGWLRDLASDAERHGAGPLRIHAAATSSYRPAAADGFDTTQRGCDLITDRSLIRRWFPYLSASTAVVAHVRRAGWLSAQQLGQTMLEAARERGVRLMRGTMTDMVVEAGHVGAVRVATADGDMRLPASDVVIAAGPMTPALTTTLGIDVPLFAERHLKISLPDARHVIPRDAPMLIWLDAQYLPWSDDERALLAADAATAWLTREFPGGVHGRPDGGGASTTLLLLYNYENAAAEVTFPLPESGSYADIVLRGMSTMVPGMTAYLDGRVRPFVDGGYYVKAPDNRPVVGPTRIGGLLLSGAYSGFGIMASAAGGDLIARHVLGMALPEDAAAFQPCRFEDARYLARLETFGDGGQL